MTITTDRYINLFTDFGFKKLFGEEPNKDLLIALLNDLLGNKEHITDLTYLKNERLPETEGDRRAVYDLYCSNDRGEKFIVEVQRAKQEHFKDRSIYYSTFAIQEQARRGREWAYELKGVYTIAIMDFVFDERYPDKYEHRIKLMDEENHVVFWDKLTFVYLQIPKFNKELSDLQNDFERWLYAFRNLHRLRHMPKELETAIFKKLFEVAEIASMDDIERDNYQESLKEYRDLKAALDTSFKEGKEEGRKEGTIQIARAMLKQGESIDKIIQYTGLTQDEIEVLR